MSKHFDAVTIEQFDEFFAAVNCGNEPYTWQRQLLETIVETEKWPDTLAIPTGGGKSSVVEIHVFANACSVAAGKRIPRRLSVVVNRRALVDSQVERAQALQRRLDESQPDDGIVWHVAQTLRAMRAVPDSGPLEIGHLRGGLPDRSIPTIDPSAVAVIGATPEMWGSRALFRGYGSTKWALPRETAALTMDAVIVLDEAHLNRQLLETARRIGQIQKYYPAFGIPTLQVVETTATPTSAAGEVVLTVDTENLQSTSDQALVSRMTCAKRLQLVPVDRWTGKPGNRGVILQAVSQVQRLCNSATRTVGCVLNHVDTAVKVAEALNRSGLTVELLVGRMRPFDVAELKKRRPGLFSPEGNKDVDVVVATQTLEVGIDADFEHLVTEFAPGSSLAQRFGRLNRAGHSDESTAVVLIPDLDQDSLKDAPPYKHEDLSAALDWLLQMNEQGSVNPIAVTQNPAPVQALGRPGFKRLEIMDVDYLSRTSADLFAEPDLDLWLNDNLEPEEATAGVVVRGSLPSDDATALEMLKLLPPEPREVFPASLQLVSHIKSQLVFDDRTRFKKQLAAGKNGDDSPFRAFIYRRGDIFLAGTEDALVPGDVLVIDGGLPITSAGVVTDKPTDKTPPKEVPLENVHLLSIAEHAAEKGLLKWHMTFAELTHAEATEEWLASGGTGRIVSSQGTTLFSGREAVSWFVVFDEPKLPENAEIEQEWSKSAGAVYLDAHQSDVAQRTELIASSLGLDNQVAGSVVLAAEHHDDGKAYPAFQRMLGRVAGGPVLAKSEGRTQLEAQSARRSSGLPPGWRHEQYSAALFFNGIVSGTDVDLRELPMHSRLAMHIVGSSHGRGRPEFPHSGNELLQITTQESDQPVNTVFDDGNWDENFRLLQREIGYYTLAFLEAVERAADAQVSREGR